MRWKTVGVAAWIAAGALLFSACGKELPLEEKIVMHPGKNAVWKKFFFQVTPRGDTLIQGAYKEFYWDATPALSTLYKDGKRQGSSQAWYSSGELKWTKVFEDGRPKGIWRLYYVNGESWGEIPHADGRREGQAKAWDSPGSPPRTAEFKEGRCIGGDCELFSPKAIPEGLTSIQVKKLEDQNAALNSFLAE